MRPLQKVRDAIGQGSVGTIYMGPVLHVKSQLPTHSTVNSQISLFLNANSDDDSLKEVGLQAHYTQSGCYGRTVLGRNVLTTTKHID